MLNQLRELKVEVLQFVCNHIISHIPCWGLRRMLYKIMHYSIGEGSVVNLGTYLMTPGRLTIGKWSHINEGCLLDCRGGITIGDSVSISHRVSIMTGSHDIHGTSFALKMGQVVIEDYAFIGVGATVLQGVKISRGGVVCAGAVVTHDVPENAIVAGIPARVVGSRAERLDYKCCYNMRFI